MTRDVLARRGRSTGDAGRAGEAGRSTGGARGAGKAGRQQPAGREAPARQGLAPVRTRRSPRRPSSCFRRLIAFDTVNPPGNERAAQEYPARRADCGRLRVRAPRSRAGAPQSRRATARWRPTGPTLPPRHVDTVLAEPPNGAQTPGRAILTTADLGSRRARHEIADRRRGRRRGCALARAGWRPARGELLIVVVVDEETGGELGAQWLTGTSREGPLRPAGQRGRRRGVRVRRGRRARLYYGVCCAEKGVFRFTSPPTGVAGHASMPTIGDNALLKLAPLMSGSRARQPPTPDRRAAGVPARRSARTRRRPGGGGRSNAARGRARLVTDLRADVRRHVYADADQRLGEDQRDPSRAPSSKSTVACRRGSARRQVRGGDRGGARTGGGRPAYGGSSFTERVVGNRSPIDSPLMEAIARLDRRARCRAPMSCHVILPGSPTRALPRRVSRVRRLRLLSARFTRRCSRPRR